MGCLFDVVLDPPKVTLLSDVQYHSQLVDVGHPGWRRQLAASGRSRGPTGQFTVTASVCNSDEPLPQPWL